MPRPSATERVAKIPQSSYLMTLLGVIGIIGGLAAYAIYAMSQGTYDQKKLLESIDPLDRVGPLKDPISNKYIAVNIRVRGGVIDMLVETQGQLPGNECEQIRNHIGTTLASHESAKTLVQQLTLRRDYQQWREGGGSVHLTIRSSPNDLNGYFRQSFRIE